MKLKRIGTLKTLRLYEKALLEDILPKYVSKAGVDDRPQEILSQIRLECHNPYFMAGVALDDSDRPVGFFVAFVQITLLGKRLYIDHVYMPNVTDNVRIYEMVKDKLGVDSVLWMTRRNPEAWIKMFAKLGHRVELHGYIIRTMQDVREFGNEK